MDHPSDGRENVFRMGFQMGCLIIFFVGSVCAPALGERLVIGADFRQPIPAVGDGPGWMDPVRLVVPSSGQITDLDIYLDITHTEVGDLQILLDTPWGDTLHLKECWFPLWQQSRPNMLATFFDDEAPLVISQGVPPYTGRFRPELDSLSQVDGRDGRGTWTLRIWDAYHADDGTLEGWELHITHIPEPAALLLYGLATLLPAYRRRCHRPRTHTK